jgi:hypothetical protein
MTFLSKLSIHIVLDQVSLDLCNQITVILIDHKSYRALGPAASLIEDSKPSAVILNLGIKHYILPAV